MKQEQRWRFGAATGTSDIDEMPRALFNDDDRSRRGDRHDRWSSRRALQCIARCGVYGVRSRIAVRTVVLSGHNMRVNWQHTDMSEHCDDRNDQQGGGDDSMGARLRTHAGREITDGTRRCQ